VKQVAGSTCADAKNSAVCAVWQKKRAHLFVLCTINARAHKIQILVPDVDIERIPGDSNRPPGALNLRQRETILRHSKGCQEGAFGFVVCPNLPRTGQRARIFCFAGGIKFVSWSIES
jgi:hypothetical protein